MRAAHQRWVIAVFGSVATLALALFAFGSFLNFEWAPSSSAEFTVVPADGCNFIISGHVAHEGSPIAGAKVEVRRIRRSAEPYGSVSTDSDGDFTYVESDNDACVVINRFLFVKPPAYRYHDYEHPALVRNGEQVEIELRSATTTLY